MTDWRALAACAGMSSAEYDPWSTSGLEAVAKAVCAHCPVVAECLADATGDRHTVRGGLSVEDRDALAPDGDTLPGMPAAVEPVVEHGLRVTYGEGCRCEGCVAANTKFAAEWRAKKRAKAQSQVEHAGQQTTFDMEAS